MIKIDLRLFQFLFKNEDRLEAQVRTKFINNTDFDQSQLAQLSD